MTKDRDSLASQNDDLLRELQLYKSAAVPTDFKPRSTMTRVARMPLANQSLNAKSSSASGKAHFGGSRGKDLLAASEANYMEGDMTLDEMM